MNGMRNWLRTMHVRIVWLSSHGGRPRGRRRWRLYVGYRCRCVLSLPMTRVAWWEVGDGDRGRG